MRYLIALLLLSAALCKAHYCCKKCHKHCKPVNRVALLSQKIQSQQDFIIGLIEGLGLTEDVENIKKCLKDIAPLLEKVKEALYLIIHLNIGDMQKGLVQLIEAVDQILALVKPCAKETKVIIKLIALLKSLDVMVVISRIMGNVPRFMVAINDAIRGYISGDMYLAGKAIGKVLGIILLDRMGVRKNN
eukprot:TRINITY_DN8095_c0_g2_i1.p1 TRINITY_DN8095_c0_g2~~TRINITY_DN8095_c0_g2_i1.p1  ORF type:complete len:189 (+),score=62.05 TRINITY_DN8095_c0_g2_i1:104-670(+)